MSKTPEFVLINCPPWGVVMPPLGIAYLSSYLNSKGIKTTVRDLNLELYLSCGGVKNKFWDLDAINQIKPQRIAEDIFRNFETKINEFIRGIEPFRIMGFSANNLISVVFAGLLAGKIKEVYPDKQIIAGGPGCYHSWDRKMAHEETIDFFVIGEGEEPLFLLLKQLQAGKDASGIPGVLSCNKCQMGNRYFPNEGAKNLDLLPWPTFSEFKLSEYNRDNGNYHPLPVLTSRGCINRCSYCIDWYMCQPFRCRSAANVIAEIRHHLEKYRITHLEFNDLLCNGNAYQLEKLCDGLIASSSKVSWISYAAIRKNVDDHLLLKMKKAGCFSLCYGIESGSNSVLKRMNKHYTKEDAAVLLAKTSAAEIEARINIIVGFPGETEDDFNQTLDFIYQNRNFISQVTNVSSFVLMPGSDIGIYPHKFGIKFADSNDPATWTDANDLSQQERNTRVKKTCRVLDELGIKRLIVNYQQGIEDNKCPVVISESKTKIISCARAKDTAFIRSNKFKRKGRGRKYLAVFGFFIFALIIDWYLKMLKKFRGSIIFPGS